MTVILDHNYLELLPDAGVKQIISLINDKNNLLQSDKKGVVRFRELFEAVNQLRAAHLDLSGDVVEIGRKTEISSSDHSLVYRVLRALMPWRKGPFSIFDIDIDSEWRSNRKWRRVMPVLPDLKDKIIADIGASNGYYMFRMAQQQPALVLGFEPYLQHYFTFRILNRFAGCDNLRMEPLGVESINLFTNSFDIIFLMGIIYHRSAPIDMLRDLKKALKPGGTLIVESQAIPGNDPVALFPAGRYAKVPGTYFVPTASCLTNWLTRAGFKEVELFFSHKMDSSEQRRTDWMVFESYADFIDSANPELTVEGYPAPLRVFIKARTR